MIETVIEYRWRSIGSMEVRRVLPFVRRRSVGPFVFVDDFGPVEIKENSNLDVLPHPHIGLATVTYLFKGRMTHRDSLGNVQIIEPGEVNWMTAGKGIVHSERVSDAGNEPDANLLGLQTWVALPEKDEESQPAFAHHAAEELPLVETEDLTIRLILGELFGQKSPVETLSNPVYAECRIREQGVLSLPEDIEDRSIYILSGSLEIDGKTFDAGNMVVFETGKEALIRAEENSKLMIIGGDRPEKERFVWWNFVATSKERIEAAREDWKNGRFKMIPGETEFIRLPKI